jgi:large subunit ribosomal protein L31
MKKGIHPKYYENAKIKCACGAEYTVGSTQPYMEVEICAKCHPIYTGKEKLVDTLGQIQKFKKRLEKAKKAN